jgi:hypothetical protein
METVADTAAVDEIPLGIEEEELAGIPAGADGGWTASVGRATAGSGWAHTEPAAATKATVTRNRTGSEFSGKCMIAKV